MHLTLFAMDSRFRPQVPPTMAYLEEITRTGQRIVDVFLIGMLPTVHEMTVYLADGSKPVYYIEADTKTVMAHYRQAIEYSGYGPRGLGNLIHANVMEKCREKGKEQEQFEVLVSQECFDRIKSHAQQWTYYGYALLVSPSFKGVTFAIREKSEGVINRRP